MTIYQQMQNLGVEIAHWQSDLYVPVTPETTELVQAYKFRANVSTFRDQITKTRWYDIPFAYDDFDPNAPILSQEAKRAISLV